MKLIFIDDLKGGRNKDLFGLAMVCVDASKYGNPSGLCMHFLNNLNEINWDPGVEFKGKYLFSRDAGEQGKTPEEMIGLTENIISWLASDGGNVRASILVGFNYKGESIENYCKILLQMLANVDRTNKKGGGKNLAGLYFDQFSGCEKRSVARQIDQSAGTALRERGYVLIEGRAFPVESATTTAGIIYADVLAYIAKWRIENPTKHDLTLFDLIDRDDFTLKRKVNTVHNLFEQVKKIEILDLNRSS